MFILRIFKYNIEAVGCNVCGKDGHKKDTLSMIITNIYLLMKRMSSCRVRCKVCWSHWGSGPTVHNWG